IAAYRLHDVDALPDPHDLLLSELFLVERDDLDRAGGRSAGGLNLLGAAVEALARTECNPDDEHEAQKHGQFVIVHGTSFSMVVVVMVLGGTGSCCNAVATMMSLRSDDRVELK